MGLATIKRAEAADYETSMTAANDLAVRSRPPASNPSTRTEAAPECDYESVIKKELGLLKRTNGAGASRHSTANYENPI